MEELEPKYVKLEALETECDCESLDRSVACGLLFFNCIPSKCSIFTVLQGDRLTDYRICCKALYTQHVKESAAWVGTPMP